MAARSEQERLGKEVPVRDCLEDMGGGGRSQHTLVTHTHTHTHTHLAGQGGSGALGLPDGWRRNEAGGRSISMLYVYTINTL